MILKSQIQDDLKPAMRDKVEVRKAAQDHLTLAIFNQLPQFVLKLMPNPLKPWKISSVPTLKWEFLIPIKNYSVN